MNRRSLLQGVMGGAAALILPPSLSEDAGFPSAAMREFAAVHDMMMRDAMARRYWSLDSSMLSGSRTFDVDGFHYFKIGQVLTHLDLRRMGQDVPRGRYTIVNVAWNPIDILRVGA